MRSCRTDCLSYDNAILLPVRRYKTIEERQCQVELLNFQYLKCRGTEAALKVKLHYTTSETVAN
ncbi:hypothetical protein D3C81_2145800 [compost metagenome]